MNIGYARVSKFDQSLDLQLDTLKEAGCETIFTDQGVSGAKTERPELKKALEYLREGDTLVVWSLDRLGRSLPHLIEVTKGLEERGIGFKSVQQQMDTTTASGKLIFHMFGAIAEFERSLIRDRTQAGLKAARARGRNGGRPKTLTPEQIKMGVTLAKEGSMAITAICEQLGCSRSTYYRQIAPHLTSETTDTATFKSRQGP